MIRVVVTGSECTGKTTLARALAEHYETVWVPEYVRQYVEEKGSAPEYRDVEAIAHGQIALEDSIAAEGSPLLIQDSDLLSTIVYSHHYYGDCPLWIEEALLDRRADLYLVADIDVPWAPDGKQRDRGDRREEMQDLFRQALGDRGSRFVDIRGSREKRLHQAISAIDRRLSASD
jgi:NadR type nicotinamide-nucleotide adenylyltransferase